MTRRLSPRAPGPLLAVLTLAFAGCTVAMSTPPPADTPESGEYSNSADHWPLVFHAHWFGAACYSTRGCRVEYAGFAHRDDDEAEMTPSISSLGGAYPSVLTGGWGPLPNFPPPAVVDWISSDGTRLHAEVDFNAIFADRLVLHSLERAEIGPTYNPQPEIILEVADRTINVYMRSHISTKELQKPGNRFSRFRSDLTKAYSRTY